jgi:hypothetical protein
MINFQLKAKNLSMLVLFWFILRVAGLPNETFLDFRNVEINQIIHRNELKFKKPTVDIRYTYLYFMFY